MKKTETEVTNVPALSNWECALFGCGFNGLVVTPTVDNVPNRFWRWMQFLFFGNQWRQKQEITFTVETPYNE